MRLLGRSDGGRLAREADRERHPGQAARRLPSIDGFRAVACLMVLTYHTAQFSSLSPAVWAVVQRFTAGVSLFIGLSGFCLFYPVVLQPDRFSSRRFYAGRVKRIVPAYYASMVFCAVLLPQGLVLLARAAGYSARWQPFPALEQWLTHLTFTHLFSTQTWDGINGSYWSLGLEAEFYVLFPLLVLLYRRWGLSGLFVPGLVSCVWNTVAIMKFGWRSPFVPAQFLWEANAVGMGLLFTAGMVAAWAVLRRPPREHPVARRWATTIGGAGLAYCLWAPDAIAPGRFSFLVTGVGVGLILWAVGDGSGRMGRLLQWRALTALGVVSYSFYLVHQPMEWYCSRLGLGLGLNGLSLWAFQLTFGFGCVLAVATIGFRVFERRGMSSFSRTLAPPPVGSPESAVEVVAATAAHHGRTGRP